MSAELVSDEGLARAADGKLRPHGAADQVRPAQGRLARLWEEHVSSGPLLRFVAVGGLSVSVDVLVLYVLHGVLGLHLAIATTLAYAASLGVNYSLNHAWVFRADGQHARRVMRYAILVAINFGSTLGLVTGLTALGVYYLLSKCVAIGLNAILNYTSFGRWVFR